MSIQSDFSIWIIEDMLGEVEKFYLQPLERIATESGGCGPFPNIHVVMLGVNDTQKKLIGMLRRSVTQRYPCTQPKFHPPIAEHEIDPDDFIEFLQDEIGEKDVVLIDPTVRGRGWPQPPDSDNYLYYVFKRVKSAKDAANEDRVLMVSNVGKPGELVGANMDANMWRRMQEKTIGKLGRDQEKYDTELKSRLEPFIYSSEDWSEYLNEDGKKNFKSFVEDTRKNERAKTIFDAVGRCATWALLHLLSTEQHCARDLIEATNGKFYYDPHSKQRSSQVPFVLRAARDQRNLKGASDLYKILIRRFVLYGLRMAWTTFCPEKTVKEYERDFPDHYKLWVEVTAADYFWYSDELRAVKSILKKLREPQLSFASGTKIDLESVGCDFVGKQGDVKFAEIRGGRLGIRRDAARSPCVRFFDGSISFNYKGETCDGKARFCYDIVFDGNENSVPENGATDDRWRKFWADSDNDFLISRRGHVDKLQTRLASRCCFATLEDMLSFSAPMSEEIIWWEQVRPKIESLVKHVTAERMFDPELQSTVRINRAPRRTKS